MNEARSHVIRAFTFLLLLWSPYTLASAAPYSLGQLIPELHLKDGTVLRSVTVVSVGSTGVMAKWEGGRGSIKFNQLPNDVQASFAKIAPPPPPPEPPNEHEKYLASKAQLDATYAEILRKPEPVKPNPPEQIKGDVGQSDGIKKEIRGQVFVTSREGINYKLGAVTVYVFGAEEFHVLRNKLGIALRPTYSYYDTLFERAIAKSDETSAGECIKILDVLRDSEFSYLPTAPSAETDADGRFELRHTLKEPYVIVAKANRSVGDKTEHYEWVINSDKIGQDGKVLLSNSNMRE